MPNIIPYFSLLKSEEKKSADFVIFGNIVSKHSIFWDENYPANVNSFDFVAQLNDVPDDYEITVHINSNGGEVKEGLAIYNALKKRNATTICEGFAASAASLVFMGGKRRIMNRASLLFIHQAATYAEGNPDELDKIAQDLRIITAAAVNAYKEGGVTLSDEELDAMVKAETWIPAEDALKNGFATEIADVEQKEGAVTNSAMSFIAAALNRTPQASHSLGEASISIDLDTTRIESLVTLLEKVNVGLEKLDAQVQGSAFGGKEPSPKADPTQQKKGFFNFTKEE